MVKFFRTRSNSKFNTLEASYNSVLVQTLKSLTRIFFTSFSSLPEKKNEKIRELQTVTLRFDKYRNERDLRVNLHSPERVCTFA